MVTDRVTDQGPLSEPKRAGKSPVTQVTGFCRIETFPRAPIEVTGSPSPPSPPSPAYSRLPLSSSSVRDSRTAELLQSDGTCTTLVKGRSLYPAVDAKRRARDAICGHALPYAVRPLGLQSARDTLGHILSRPGAALRGVSPSWLVFPRPALENAPERNVARRTSQFAGASGGLQ